MRRLRLAGGFDAATAGLILGGAALIAASIVAAVSLLAPPKAPAAVSEEPTATPVITGRTSAALPPDRVATVLTVDAGAGAASVAKPGDHIDILGYFAHQTTGADSVTRVLLSDVPVVSTDRSGSSIALTLAVPQQSALLLQEAQALGAQPFVTVHPLQPVTALPSSFSDTDLANRLSAGARAR